MTTDISKCIPKLEQAYYLIEQAGVDSKIHRALATSLFIYARQSGIKQEERILKIVKSIIPAEELIEISEDCDFESGDYYLLLPLSIALRALETNLSNELIQGINLLIEAANCLNNEKTYELHLSMNDSLKSNKTFLKLLTTFLKIDQKLFTDEDDDIQPEEVLEITKALDVKNSLAHVMVLKHAARVAESIEHDDRISPEDKPGLYIMALKTLISSEDNLKLAVVFAKIRKYDFAANY